MSAIQRHLRVLKRALAILVLLLSVASFAFWVISYAWPQHSGDMGMARAMSLGSTDPRVLSYSYDPDPFGLYETKPVINLPGVSLDRGGNGWRVDLHWALPTLCFAVVGILLFLRRKLPRSAEACLSCGYDLRATPTRCPECGRSSAD